MKQLSQQELAKVSGGDGAAGRGGDTSYYYVDRNGNIIYYPPTHR